MKRILVIANKTWEVEPLLNALLNPEFNQGFNISFPIPATLNYPRRSKQGDIVPRGIWLNETKAIQIEIWSIQDIMTPPTDKIQDVQQYYSSSEQKFKDLPKLFTGDKPSLVIAFGTAGCPDAISYNGSVVIGSNIFIHDGHPEGGNPYSKLKTSDFEKLITSTVDSDFFERIAIELSKPECRDAFTKRLLSTSLNPAQPQIIAHKEYLALSNVNITDYREYTIKDVEGLGAFKNAGTGKRLISVETTHGLIRLQTDSPFIFISSITDAVGHFDTEVSPKDKAQNFAAAFNGGVVLAWLLNVIK